MCSRAERKRRRAARPEFNAAAREIADGHWITYAGRGQGMTRAAMEAFRAEIFHDEGRAPHGVGLVDLGPDVPRSSQVIPG